MSKKSSNKMRMEIFLANNNTVDGKINDFIRHLETGLGEKITIVSFLPQFLDGKHFIKFTCEIDINNFEMFQSIYYNVFDRPFSFIWEEK